MRRLETCKKTCCARVFGLGGIRQCSVNKNSSRFCIAPPTPRMRRHALLHAQLRADRDPDWWTSRAAFYQKPAKVTRFGQRSGARLKAEHSLADTTAGFPAPSLFAMSGLSHPLPSRRGCISFDGWPQKRPESFRRPADWATGTPQACAFEQCRPGMPAPQASWRGLASAFHTQNVGLPIYTWQCRVLIHETIGPPITSSHPYPDGTLGRSIVGHWDANMIVSGLIGLPPPRCRPWED